MSYILMIWTVVGYAGTQTTTHSKYDWRPLGEFHMEEGRIGKKSALQMCEDAAKQLAIKPESYRCVRNK